MKKYLFCVLSLCLGGVMMASHSGCSSDGLYARFESKQPEPGFKIDYPVGWKAQETRNKDKGLSSVMFLEKDPAKPYPASVSITVKEVGALKPEVAGVKEFSEALVEFRLKRNGARLLLKEKCRLQGSEGVKVEIQFLAPERLYARSAPQVPVKQRFIVFKKNDKLYLICYEAVVKDFSRRIRIFEHMVRSLTFEAPR